MSARPPPDRIKRAAIGCLLPGEKLLMNYSRDFTVCMCPATHMYSTVEVLPIAVSQQGDRCLQCGLTWRRKIIRTDTARRVSLVNANRLPTEIIANRQANMRVRSGRRRL